MKQKIQILKKLIFNMHVKKIIFQLFNISFKKKIILTTKDKTRILLHLASQRGRCDIVEYIIPKGANKNAKDKDEKTPYDAASN